MRNRKMKNTIRTSQLNQMIHFAFKWTISVGAAMIISMASSYANASSPKTLSFVVDNDILVPGSRDQDYTGGFNLSYVSNDANQSIFYFNPAINFIDHLVGLKQSKNNLYGIETGLYGFTPEDTQFVGVNKNDRPYSSLLYFSNTHERVDIEEKSAWQSRLTIGVLGLDIAPNLQEGVHNLTGSQQPLGWEHQVSDGGEPTIRYQLANQKAVELGLNNVEVKYSKQVSIGYISETSLSVSGRFGQFNSSWWNFNPEFSSYGEQRNSLSGNQGESFGFVGVSLKLRFYNAFLQGLFRQSDLTYKTNQLNHILLEAWAGYTHSLNNGFQINYIIRGHSSEVKRGTGNRALVWGGVSISKSWY